MGTASLLMDFKADAATVWAVIGDFNGLHKWHPGVADSRVEDGGRLRHLTLRDGGFVVERLMQLDPARRLCTYGIIEGRLPIRAHSATLQVVDNGHGSRVSWACEFESAGPPDAELTKIFRQIFEAGLNNLQAVLEKQAKPAPA